MSNNNNSGDKRSDSGGGRGNNRRYFRRRKPSVKGQEPTKPESSKPESSKTEPRKAPEPSPRGRTRRNGKAEFSGKGDRDRDRRGRRRRRRSRTDRGDETPVVQESILAAIDHEYKPPQSVFVYTYVLRPGAPAPHEFRPEHFSRVGRRLEDFDIDLSPIFPVDGAPKKEARPVLEIDPDDDINRTDYNYEGDDEEFPDESTDD